MPVIGRKRARLDKRRAKVWAMRKVWLDADDPIQKWSIDRIRRTANAWAKRSRRGRDPYTARSRWQYGQRTGGRW